MVTIVNTMELHVPKRITIWRCICWCVFIFFQ